jgi:hypothetical protein
VEPQPVNDRFSPPPYFVLTTGKTFLTIEAGLGNYEVFIELSLPRRAAAPARLKADQ